MCRILLAAIPLLMLLPPLAFAAGDTSEPTNPAATDPNVPTLPAGPVAGPAAGQIAVPMVAVPMIAVRDVMMYLAVPAKTDRMAAVIMHEFENALSKAPHPENGR